MAEFISDSVCGLANQSKPDMSALAYYFYKWQHKGVWQQLREMLVKKERQRQGREAQPSRVAIDSQSVKQCGCFSGQVGVDGNKKIDGRKRHLAVDSLGLSWAIYVGAANEADAVAGLELLPQLKSKRLTLICADAAYRGDDLLTEVILKCMPDIMGGKWTFHKSLLASKDSFLKKEGGRWKGLLPG